MLFQLNTVFKFELPFLYICITLVLSIKLILINKIRDDSVMTNDGLFAKIGVQKMNKIF